MFFVFLTEQSYARTYPGSIACKQEKALILVNALALKLSLFR